MILISSWDDGGKCDIKLADLLMKYQIPAIFYIPNKSELTHNEIIELSRRFEIGGHTVTHPQDLKLCDDERLWHEIADNKKWLQKLIGKEMTSFCYPRGRHDERVVDFVQKAGYQQARTTVVLNTKLPTDIMRIQTTIHVKRIRPEYRGFDWLALSKKKYIEAEEDGYFHLWGHSLEIDKENLWNELEDLLKFIYGRRNKNN